MDRNGAYLLTATLISVAVGAAQAWHNLRPTTPAVELPLPVLEKPLQAPPVVELPLARRPARPAQEMLGRMRRRIRALEQERRLFEHRARQLEGALQPLRRQVAMLEALLEAGSRLKSFSVSPVPPSPAELEEAAHWESLGQQLLLAGRMDQAGEAYYRALFSNPQNPDLHYNQGVLADRFFQEPARALFHFKSFLSLAPQDPDAAQVRSWVRRIADGSYRRE